MQIRSRWFPWMENITIGANNAWIPNNYCLQLDLLPTFLLVYHINVDSILVWEKTEYESMVNRIHKIKLSIVKTVLEDNKTPEKFWEKISSELNKIWRGFDRTVVFLKIKNDFRQFKYHFDRKIWEKINLTSESWIWSEN
jgi:hypothetical protein